MRQQVQKIHNTFSAICRPNPKLYPERFLHEFQWEQNLTSLYTCLLFFISTIIFAIQQNFSCTFNRAFFCLHGSLFLCFACLCRSYLPIFNVLNILVTIGFGFIAPETIPETLYIYPGFILLVLTCIMIRSGNIKLTLVGATMHLFTYLTKFREKWAILIQNEEPEIFAEKLVKSTAFLVALILLTEISMVKTLEKRTLELLRVRGALETALDQQKTFILSFSHELRNPINSLLGNLQLVLQGGGLSARTTEMIHVAKVCGEILLHNINNVLDTGKYEIGKLEVNPVSTPLCEVFQRTWSIYSELLRQKKLKGHLKIDKGIPAVVKIDSHKLNQIMLNLIGNSIKFTEKGSITVTAKWLKGTEINEKCFEPIPYDDIDEGLFEKEENLSTMMNISKFLKCENGRRQYSNQQEVRGILKIIVKDTGSGMKKEALEKLFKKFSQVSENVSQRQIGTGLGLFITKEICLAMNGEIRAYSKFGVGTTFIICIPTISIPSCETQRVDSESILSELTSRQLKALVADDSPFNVDLIKNYFSQFGASVVALAYNGCDAYMKYQECREGNGQLDVVTLDIDMPILDGKRVCDRIRQYEKERKLEPALIILISGNYDKEQIEEYLDQGKEHRADCFLRKPVSSTDFNRAIYNLLQDRSL